MMIKLCSPPFMLELLLQTRSLTTALRGKLISAGVTASNVGGSYAMFL